MDVKELAETAKKKAELSKKLEQAGCHVIYGLLGLKTHCKICLVVRREFAENNKEALDALLEDYKASVEYVNNNPAEAAQISEQVDLIPAAVAEKAIPKCNIVYLDGAEMKEKLPGFLNILFEANHQSVGGALPGDDFYYEK